jgi:hypothetical protein
MEWLFKFSAFTISLLSAILIYNFLAYLCGYYKDFLRWLGRALKDTHNFPHFLVFVATVLLVVFACVAWREAQRSTKVLQSQLEEARRSTEALQGQLKVMLAGQRPYIGVAQIERPKLQLSPQKGSEIVWRFQIRNYGPGLAREIKFHTFIKTEDGQFERSFGSKDPSTASDMPPPPTDFYILTTALSEPDLTLTQDRFDKLMKTNFSIQVLVELEYEDIYNNDFTNAFCLAHIVDFEPIGRQPSECAREKASGDLKKP